MLEHVQAIRSRCGSGGRRCGAADHRRDLLWQAGSRPSLDGLGQRFGWLAAPRSTVVQPGPVHGGLTSDLAAELERLLAHLVG